MNKPATPSTVRFLNRRSIVRHLLNAPALSRAQLAKTIGMSPVTTGKIVNHLIDQHVLEAVKPTEMAAQVGRPADLVRLNSARPRFLTVQLGVTHTRAAFVPLGFNHDDVWDIEFSTPPSAAEWAAQLSAAVSTTITSDLWGVIISAPGIVDHATNRVLFSPNLHWSEKQDFGALLRHLTSAPTLLVQEIQALALGEVATHPDVKDFLLVDFSHGLGGAAVVGGELYKTPLPFNSELGHSRVIGNRRRCGCGAVGCVETLVSRRGLFQNLPPSRGPYQWEKVIRHIQAHGLEESLKTAINAAAAAIGAALNVLGLEHVIITGSINQLPPQVGQHLAAEIRNATLWGRFGTVTCHFSPRHRVRGLIKAALEDLILADKPRSTISL